MNFKKNWSEIASKLSENDEFLSYPNFTTQRIPSLSIRRQYDFIIENCENFILKMQNWGHFKITCIAYFNKIRSGTLIFFGLNISIFRVLEVSISVTGAPGDPKIFFLRYSHIDVLNMS